MLSKAGRIRYVLATLLAFIWLSLTGRNKKAEKRLLERFFKLGGIYIKFLQILAVRENDKQTAISGLQDSMAVFDQVKYEPIDITRLLRSELGYKSNNIAITDSKPFAAGSFGQVYKGHVSNQEVVIKVLRPSVDEYLRFDLNLLGKVARVVSFMLPKSIIDFDAVFKDLKRVSLQEIDYRNEVKNAVRLFEKLSDHPVIHIPKTYEELSTDHIIVQEKVTGLPLTQLLSSDVDDKLGYVWHNYSTNMNYVMEELAVESLMGSLAENGSHGDPHPGNIFVLPNNRVALIDFGIDSAVHEYKPELMQLIVEYSALYRGKFNPTSFSKAMLCYFAPQLTQSMQTLSTFLNQNDLAEQILDEVGLKASESLQERVSDPAVSTMLGQYRMLAIFTQVINKNNRFGLRVVIDTPEFLRSTQIFLNLIHILGCDKRLIGRTFDRVIASYDFTTQTQGPNYDSQSIDSSLHSVASWFERLQYSDPALYTNIMKRWKGVPV